jgi:CheY-like chemotaxis protein
MYQILLVDDELNVLTALRRELQDDYTIQAFSDPLEALHFSEKNHFSKPWHEYTLINTLSQAIAYNDLMKENRLLAKQAEAL